MKWVWLIGLSFSALAQTVYVAPARVLKPGAYELSSEARYWQSSSRFDTDGEEVPFLGDESFSYLEGEIIGRFSATKELQFSFAANFRQNAASVESPVGSQTYESASSSGVQAISAIMTYAFDPVEKITYALEGFYRYHPYKNAQWDLIDPTSDLVLGDDGGEYGVGLIGTYTSPSKNYLSFRGQYKRPGREISTELAWDIQGAIVWTKFAMVAGVQGVQSLNQDAYSEDPLLKPAINTGGTNLYNSINRQYVAPYIGANIALGKKWRLETRYQTVMNPRSYDSGSLISLAIASRTEPNNSDSIDQAFKEYEIEATVVKLSPKKQFVIIDKGLAQNVQKGQRFDLFHFDFVGGNILLGRAVVIQVNADQAVLRLTSRFSLKHEIKAGTVARGLPK
jgi:hypothetical protein